MAFEMSSEEKIDTKRLVLWLAEATEHTDNITEFIGVVLVHMWKSVGLPGKLPRDEHGLIDLAAVESIAAELPKWPDIDKLTANTSEHGARFYSVERSEDVHRVEDAAVAAGFETYPYRRDLVVVDPMVVRKSSKAEEWNNG